MFVQYSLHIEMPIDTVASALAQGPRKWFPRIDGEGSAAVGPSVAGVRLRKKVTVSIGEPVAGGSWTVVPVNWHATSHRTHFHDMMGKVVLRHVEARETRLAV